MKGLLCDYGTKDSLLVFVCPRCSKEHTCLVGSLHYNNGDTNVWAYKDSSESENVIELYPSFNNEKHCGWHSPYNWAVEVMKLQEGQNRNAATETWLHCELEIVN